MGICSCCPVFSSMNIFPSRHRTSHHDEPKHKSRRDSSSSSLPLLSPTVEQQWPSYQSSPSVDLTDQLLIAAKKNMPMEVWHIIKVLKVSPNGCNQAGQTALHLAAMWGNVDVVALLVSKDVGADPNLTNFISGATPLHMVIEGKKIREATRLNLIVDVLLEAGAGKTISDMTGRLPFDCVTPSTPGYKDLLPKLHAPEPMPSMFRAIQGGDLTNILQAFYDGKSSPQELACQVYRNRTTVQAIVDLMVTSVVDASAPLEVWMQADLDALKILLQCGAPLSSLPEPRKRTFSPSEVSELMGEDGMGEATIPSTAPIVRLLDRIQHALSKDTRALGSSCTSIEDKLADGQEDLQLPPIVRLWLEACQALQDRQQGDIALFWQCGRHKPAPLLTQDELCQYWHNAARRGHVLMLQAIHRYLPMLFDVNAVNRQGMTALHFAARSGKKDVVQFLLGLPKTDVAKTDCNGMRALDAAMVNGHTEVVELLQSQS